MRLHLSVLAAFLAVILASDAGACPPQQLNAQAYYVPVAPVQAPVVYLQQQQAYQAQFFVAQQQAAYSAPVAPVILRERAGRAGRAVEKTRTKTVVRGERAGISAFLFGR